MEYEKEFPLYVVTTITLSFLLLILLVLFYLILIKKPEELSIISLSASRNKDDLRIEAIIRNSLKQSIENIYLDMQMINVNLAIEKTINIGPIKLKPESEGVVTRSFDIKNINSGRYILRILLYHNKHILKKQVSLAL